jgi:hypothetical protein
MNCQEIKGKIVDCLSGGLAPVDRAAFDQHLASCGSCRRELEELNETWSRLGILAQETPGPGLRAGFYKMLESYKEGLEGKRAPRCLRAMAAAVLVAVGFAAGFWMQAQRLRTPTRPAVLTSDAQNLHQEINRLRQQVSLSLLERDSAADRLKAVSLASEIREPDPALLQALLDTLDNDPSVGVRLATVDALYLFADQPQVREALHRSLEKQTSPLVQIAVIDMIVALREKQAAAALHKLLGDRSLSPEVRERARSGISQLI